MTSMPEINKVRDLAMQLRRVLDLIPRSELPLPMREFPHGACGDASLLLGAFLSDAGFNEFVFVSAERGAVNDNTWTSHAWLSSGTLIVDITADQFIDAPAPVIVEHNSGWHAQFRIENTAPSDFRDTHSPANDYLHALYSRLKSMLAAGTGTYSVD